MTFSDSLCPASSRTPTLTPTPTSTKTSTPTVTPTGNGTPTPTPTFRPTAIPTSGGGGGNCFVQTANLSGPAINGVTSSGVTTATEFGVGSSLDATFSATVKNVKLTDGTQLDVTIVCTGPFGIITLSHGSGSATVDAGTFNINSPDTVRIYTMPISNLDSYILIGSFN